jgi:hypothetical protein
MNNVIIEDYAYSHIHQLKTNNIDPRDNEKIILASGGLTDTTNHQYYQIENDIEMIHLIIKDIDELVSRQGENISDIENNIHKTHNLVSISEEVIDDTHKYTKSRYSINTVLYTVYGSVITGVVSITLGLKPALITGVISGGCILGYKTLSFIRSFT